MTQEDSPQDEGPEEILPMPRWAALLLLLAGSATVVAAGWDYLLTPGAPAGAEHSAHINAMLQLAHLFRGGHVDLFLDQINLGAPFLLTHPPLPGVLSGALASLALCCQSPLWLYKLLLVLLWASLPWSWYVGGRWLGLHRAAALALALLVLGIRGPMELGLTFESLATKGLFAQSFGFLLLPLALGSWYRFLHLELGHWRTPIFWLTLTCLSHVFLGMYAAFGVGLMIFAGHGKGHRLVRAIPLYIAVALLLAWWLVPLYQQRHLLAHLPWPSDAYNGWSLKQIGSMVLDRDFFDHERIPWMTSLLLFGLWGLWRRRNEFVFAQWWVLISFFTGLLFLGRTNLGSYYGWLPLHSDINVLRYLSGVHICGLLLMAIGIYHLAMLLYALVYNEWGQRAAAALLGVAIVAGSGVFLYDAHQHMRDVLVTFDHNAPTYRRVMRRLAHQRSKYRFVASKRLGTGDPAHRDLLSALSRRPQLRTRGQSFQSTHSATFTSYFNYTPGAYSLYNVRHVVTSLDRPTIPMAGLKQVLAAPPYAIYETDAAKGYFSFIKVPVRIYGDLAKLSGRLRMMVPTLYQRGALPALAGPGKPSNDEANAMVMTAFGVMSQRLRGKDVSLPLDVFARRVAATRPAPDADVLSQRHRQSRYEARVHVRKRPAWLLLRVTYSPDWQASIDGEGADIIHVAPNFMAVQVPKGRHKVQLQFRSPWWQRWGVLLMVLVLMGIAAWAAVPLVKRGVRLIKDWRQARQDPSVPPSVR